MPSRKRCGRTLHSSSPPFASAARSPNRASVDTFWKRGKNQATTPKLDRTGHGSGTCVRYPTTIHACRSPAAKDVRKPCRTDRRTPTFNAHFDRKLAIYTKQGGRQPPPQVGAITSHLGSLHTNRAAAEFSVGVIPPSLNPTPHSRATTTRSLPPRKHAARAKGGNSTLFRQGGATGGFPLTDVGLPRNTTPYRRQTDPHNGRQHRPDCHPGPSAG